MRYPSLHMGLRSMSTNNQLSRIFIESTRSVEKQYVIFSSFLHCAPNDQIISYSPTFQKEIDDVKTAAINSRDRRLKSEIRSLETEKLRLEREWHKDMEAERKKITNLQSLDEKRATYKITKLNEEQMCQKTLRRILF